MSDPILDDVQALLTKEFGDKRILEQIQRAAENNEVISNFERNYVRKLAEKHLGKKPLAEKKPSEASKPIVPDVAIPSPSTITNNQTTQMLSKPPKVTKSNSKNTKIILGIGIAVLIVVIVAGASLSGISDITQQTPTTSKSFTIQTDLPSYQQGDIISLSGKSSLSLGDQIYLSIENSNDELVWSEQVNVKSGGKFSTLTFAGGFGWDKPGTFTIMAETGSEQTTNTFSFSG